MSPSEPRLRFRVEELPARLIIKLWQEEPGDAVPPNFWFVLEMP